MKVEANKYTEEGSNEQFVASSIQEVFGSTKNAIERGRSNAKKWLKGEARKKTLMHEVEYHQDKLQRRIITHKKYWTLKPRTKSS